MKMNLKNYTSTVPVERTITRIEQLLAEAGATGITKQYHQGRLASLSFRVDLPTGQDIEVRLPANHEAVLQAMTEAVRRPRRGTMDRLKDQALRTSGKLMQDWVEVQLSLIRMKQAELAQVFLPYVWDGKQTFYSALQGRNFLALTDGKEPV